MGEDDAQDRGRLSANLGTAGMGELKEYADRKGVSLTEAVRRALALLKYIDEVQGRGASVNIEENGKLKEVRFMV
jgi:hypothetical protein